MKDSTIDDMQDVARNLRKQYNETKGKTTQIEKERARLSTDLTALNEKLRPIEDEYENIRQVLINQGIDIGPLVSSRVSSREY